MKHIRPFVVVPLPASTCWVVMRVDENGKFLFEGRDDGFTSWKDDFHRATFRSEPPDSDELMRIRIFGRPQLHRETPLRILEVQRFVKDDVWIVEPDEFKGEGI